MSEPVDLTMPEHEDTHAVAIGQERAHGAVARGSADEYGEHPRNGAAQHVLGARGEAAVAKALGIPWDGADLKRPDGGTADVGPFHVRTTSRLDGRLTLHESDRDLEPYVLVIHLGGRRFRVVGWCYGREGKRPEHWRVYRPDGGCYYVPQTKLRPLTDYER